MLKSVLARGSSLAAAATMACFGFTGLASAQSTISNTGAYSVNSITSTDRRDCTIINTNNITLGNINSQSAISGDASASYNTSLDAWPTFDPSVWQNEGRDFSSWWNGVTNFVASLNSGDGWNDSEVTAEWTPPAPTDTTWAHWSPALWQANGQSFANWQNQVNAFLNANAGNWQINWPPSGTMATSGGGAVSGNATNSNTSNISINVRGSTPSLTTPSSGSRLYCPVAAANGSTIDNTGAGSVNTVTNSSSQPQVLGNSTAVGGTNLNGQVARSGAVAGSYNTYGRGASSGAAANQGNAQGAVNVANNGRGGGVPSAPVTPPVTPAPAPAVSSISNTGAYSNNSITYSDTAPVAVTNTNSFVVSSVNTQTASTGNAGSYYNTGGDSSASGAAANGSQSGVGLGVSN